MLHACKLVMQNGELINNNDSLCKQNTKYYCMFIYVKGKDKIVIPVWRLLSGTNHTLSCTKITSSHYHTDVYCFTNCCTGFLFPPSKCSQSLPVANCYWFIYG